MGDGSFLVEDFLGAITSQLDRTQDALAIKAVNRPLTYAIKDFDMELKVFVDVDAEGRVRFRSPGPGETGASSLKIGFTTITRPMIEENTVALSLSRSPTLAEAGVPEAERQRLERLGVRNTSELRRLGQSAGTAGVSRLADVPVDRLRAALSFGRPRVGAVGPAVPAPGRPVPPVTAQPPAPGRPVPPVTAWPPRPAQPPTPVFLPPGTKQIELAGRNMLVGGVPPAIRLRGQSLPLAVAEDDRVVAELPPDLPAAGTLEVDHGDGEVDTYELAAEDPWSPNGA
jgi:hypothetical protein